MLFLLDHKRICSVFQEITFACYKLRRIYVHGSVHRESMSIIVQQDATIYSFSYFCILLYMFWVIIPPIIRSTYDCNYSMWHWSNRLCYLPLWWRSWNFSSSFSTIADNGWSYHHKYADQFTEILKKTVCSRIFLDKY